MDHLVQFTISIDDKHIAQMVEQKAAKAMEDEVLKVCKSQVGGEANYWGSGEPGPMLKKAREVIIERASDKLAEKLSRTKVVKEAAARRVSEEVL